MDITGNWQMTKAVLGGEDLPTKEFDHLLLHLDPTSYQLIEDDKVIDSGLLKVNDGRNPMQMDIIGLFGPNKGKVFHCIFIVQGKRMIICYNLENDGPRPSEFVSPENSLYYLVNYKKTKEN